MAAKTVYTYLNIVGSVVRIAADKDIFPENLRKLSMFLVAPQAYDLDLTIRAVDKLAEPEGICEYRDGGRVDYRTDDGSITYFGSVGETVDGAYIRIHKKGAVSHAQVKRSAFGDTITSRVILEALDIEHLAIKNRCFLFHCSYIIYKGKAILFTAPSGTGKSTQANLWHSLRNAEIINGDRAGVLVNNSGIFAIGLPFSGSSGICKNITSPIGSIVSLSQAPETSICKLNPVLAFQKIWEGCSVPRGSEELTAFCCDTVMEVINSVPVFSLACTPDETAVAALESALKCEGL